MLADTLQEGYSVNVPVVVEHIEYDSLYIEHLSDSLTFVDNIPYNCSVPSDGMFYIEPGTLRFFEGSACWYTSFSVAKITVGSQQQELKIKNIVTMRMRPDSTHVGNVYEQIVAVKNRYGVGDTLTLKSVIVPFDSSVFNR